MSVIQTIRDKYSKVMFFVMILALLGFILMYASSDVRGLFSKSTTVGSINGSSIDYKEYQSTVTDLENKARQQNQSIDDNMRAQIGDQAWNTLVNDKLMQDVNDKLGLAVTPAEVKDMIGGLNPHPEIRRMFTDPKTGQFNAQQAAATIQQIERAKPKNADEQRQKEAWESFKAGMIQEKLSSKFDNMISGAVYTPKAILDMVDKDRNTYASVKYVQLPYTLVNDNDVKVTDADIKQYMEAHRALFEIDEPSRSIEYVSFDVVPSASDSAKIFSSLDTLKGAIAATPDSTMDNFLMRYSENQIPVQYQTPKTLQGLPNSAELLAAPAGSIIGPFIAGNSYMLAKVEEKTTFPDSVKVRHILVKTEDGGQQILSDSAAKARLDSVIAMRNAGIPFDSLVARYSDDYNPQNPDGSKGEYDFTLAQKPEISTEFGDFIFSGKTGETKSVKVQNAKYAGYHYIEILKQNAPQSVSKIAFVSKVLSPDETTRTDIYGKATAFATKVSADHKSFDKDVQATGLQKQTANGLNENSEMVGQLGASRDLIKWSYDAKIGDVSPIITIGENYVVAKLTGIQEAGLMAVTPEIRPQLESMVRRGKKAKILIDRNKGKNLDAIAQAENQQITTDDSVSMYKGTTAIGQEPKAQGYAFFTGLKENTVSPGIEGNMGVVFLSVNSRTPAANSANRNMEMEQQMSSMQKKQNASNMVLYGMRQKAQVKDSRGKFFNK